jgi:hypothetical protein
MIACAASLADTTVEGALFGAILQGVDGVM